MGNVCQRCNTFESDIYKVHTILIESGVINKYWSNIQLLSIPFSIPREKKAKNIKAVYSFRNYGTLLCVEI